MIIIQVGAAAGSGKKVLFPSDQFLGGLPGGVEEEGRGVVKFVRWKLEVKLDQFEDQTTNQGWAGSMTVDQI